MSFGNKLAGVTGIARPDRLAFFDVGSASVGASVVGKYVAADTYQVKEGDSTRQVRFIKLVDAVEFKPIADNHDKGEIIQHLAIGVSINADTKHKLDPDTLPVGSYVLIRYLGQDAEFNNLRRFNVLLITRAQYLDLLNVSAGEPGRQD